MNTSLNYCLQLRGMRRLGVGLLAVGLLGWPAQAAAQLVRLGGSVAGLYPGGIMRGTDIAHDPVNDVYLLVTGNGTVHGVFVNASGSPVSGSFVIMDGSLGWAHFPRAEYSPHAPNGLGGSGGFLVTWHHSVGSTNFVFSRIVSYDMPGGNARGIQMISDGADGGTWWETGPAMAYSRASGLFLVAWRTIGYGIRGRFVDATGTPYGGVIQIENPGGARDPSVAWNPATNEFGIAYTGWNSQGAFAAFRRLRSDGLLSGRTTFGFSSGTFATGIDASASTGRYVLTWALHPGTMSATFDPFGNLLGTNFVSSRIGHDQSLGMSYNGASGTFLAVGSDHFSFEIAGVEMNSAGVPTGTTQIITDGARRGSNYPLTTWRAGTNQWGVVYTRDFAGATTQVVATSSTGGGGGGTIGPVSTPPSPSSSDGCTTPDPFASIGGGTCVNGGWVPSSAPAPPPAPTPAPPPSPAPSTCSTAAPGAGWVCVNGGWLPPGHPGAVGQTSGSVTVNTGQCTTSDPFVSIGGGTCINGGWVPTASSCATPDPFVSIGGGVCINGGWIPRG